MKLLLPTTLEESPDLPAQVEAVAYDPAVPVPPAHLDADALVAWANGSGTLAAVADRMPNLRWVQSLYAGSDAVLAAGFPSGVVLTGGVGLHSRPVAEHTLALILTLVRRLPAARQAQHEHRWATELGGHQPLHPAGPVTTLLGARVLVWGFGAIARTLAPMLTALGADVRGVARSAGERDGYAVVAEDALDEALARADVLVMILPSGDATDQALSAQRLAALPQHAYVVNVGRGPTVDEEALLAALRQGRLAGAAVDVTAREPLPAGSPLWTGPNLLITPHAAGGRPVGSGDLIAENIRALLAGESLRNVIER